MPLQLQLQLQLQLPLRQRRRQRPRVQFNKLLYRKAAFLSLIIESAEGLRPNSAREPFNSMRWLSGIDGCHLVRSRRSPVTPPASRATAQPRRRTRQTKPALLSAAAAASAFSSSDARLSLIMIIVITIIIIIMLSLPLLDAMKKRPSKGIYFISAAHTQTHKEPRRQRLGATFNRVNVGGLNAAA